MTQWALLHQSLLSVLDSEAKPLYSIMTIIIPYKGEQMGLCQLLVSLQPQLHPDDDIYILDLSRTKTAKELVLKYGSTRCYIMVEPTDKPISDAVKFGLQSMKENKQEGALLLLPNSVVSTTFIANLKRAASHDDWDVLVPRVSFHERMDANFTWFCPPTTTITRIPKDEPISDAAVYMKARKIDKDFSLDFLQNVAVGKFSNELVVSLA